VSAGQHTPGPWINHKGIIHARNANSPHDHPGKTCTECGHEQGSCYDLEVVSTLDPETYEFIRDEFWGEGLYYPAPSEADLRLIAAAPDLLDASKDALELIEAMSIFEGDTVRSIRAAIAKATGGQA